jgi:DNA-binding NarL/FixJ family response regulator
VPTSTVPTVATVAVVSPHDVVAVGLRTMLEQAAPPSLQLVDPNHEEPDIVLFDVVALLDEDTSELDHWVKETASTVVAMTRPLRPDLGALALEHGAEAVVGLSATAEEIVGVALSAAAGTLDTSDVALAAERDTRLGDTVGLSPRETDVLRLVVLGFSNHEIARELYVSVNSVKTYIRSAYRKIAVTTRPQVVSWCVRHGFPPPHE